jgi:serine/threonine-protein kinase
MKAGKFDEACPKLAESQRLDPGVGTLFNLARCYEQTGRLASAWSRYLEASQEAERRGEPRRARAARRFADRLEPGLHRLVILVPVDSRIDGLAVERGGTPVGKGAWGAKVPVDAGEVVVRASAPGHEPWEKAVEMGGDKKLRIVEIPRLEKTPTEPVPPVFDVEQVPGEPWYRDKLGWGLVAGGVVLAGGGAFATIRGNNLADDAAGEMSDLGERDRLFDEADANRTAGAILLGAGAAVAIAGAVRLALAPGPTERRVQREPVAALVIGRRSAALRLAF